MGEWNAQFLGDRAFALNNAEKVNLRWEAKQWRAGQIWAKWNYPFNPSSPYSWGHKEQDDGLGDVHHRQLAGLSHLGGLGGTPGATRFFGNCATASNRRRATSRSTGTTCRGPD